MAASTARWRGSRARSSCSRSPTTSRSRSRSRPWRRSRNGAPAHDESPAHDEAPAHEEDERMNKSLLWRGLLILAVVAISAASALPFGEKIKLGLDLEGGMHLVLRVETEDALRAERDKVMERLVQAAREDGLTTLGAQAVDDTSFAVTMPATPGAREKLEALAKRDFAEWQLGFGDGRVVVSLPQQERERLADMAVRQAQQTIENRVNAFGVAEPIIQRQGLGGDRIVVQLPGVEDPERVKELLKETAFLEFRIVDYPQRGA